MDLSHTALRFIQTAMTSLRHARQTLRVKLSKVCDRCFKPFHVVFPVSTFLYYHMKDNWFVFDTCYELQECCFVVFTRWLISNQGNTVVQTVAFCK